MSARNSLLCGHKGMDVNLSNNNPFAAGASVVCAFAIQNGPTTR